MSDAWIAALAAVIVGVLSLIGTYISNRKSQATISTMIEYRLKELEKKVDRHNQVIERTFRLEGRMTEAEHDIRDLKGGK